MSVDRSGDPAILQSAVLEAVQLDKMKQKNTLW